MTDDDELAQWCTQQGVGAVNLTEVGLLYLIYDQHMGPKEFIEHWATAGAILDWWLDKGNKWAELDPQLETDESGETRRWISMVRPISRPRKIITTIYLLHQIDVGPRPGQFPGQ